MPEPMTLEEAVAVVDDLLSYQDSGAKSTIALRVLFAHARATLAQRREGVTEAMVQECGSSAVSGKGALPSTSALAGKVTVTKGMINAAVTEYHSLRYDGCGPQEAMHAALGAALLTAALAASGEGAA